MGSVYYQHALQSIKFTKTLDAISTARVQLYKNSIITVNDIADDVASKRIQYVELDDVFVEQFDYTNGAALNALGNWTTTANAANHHAKIAEPVDKYANVFSSDSTYFTCTYNHADVTAAGKCLATRYWATNGTSYIAMRESGLDRITLRFVNGGSIEDKIAGAWIAIGTCPSGFFGLVIRCIDADTHEVIVNGKTIGAFDNNASWTDDWTETIFYTSNAAGNMGFALDNVICGTKFDVWWDGFVEQSNEHENIVELQCKDPIMKSENTFFTESASDDVVSTVDVNKVTIDGTANTDWINRPIFIDNGQTKVSYTSDAGGNESFKVQARSLLILTETSGAFGDTWVKDSTFHYLTQPADFGGSVTYTLEVGAGINGIIDNIKLKQSVDYKGVTFGNSPSGLLIDIWNYETGAWDTLYNILTGASGCEGSITLDISLARNKINDSGDECKIRYRLHARTGPPDKETVFLSGYMKVDYCRVECDVDETIYEPISGEVADIDGSDVHVTCKNHLSEHLNADDPVRIGWWNENLLSMISREGGSNFIASRLLGNSNDLRGLSHLDILKQIAAQEGCHWFYDHGLNYKHFLKRWSKIGFYGNAAGSDIDDWDDWAKSGTVTVEWDGDDYGKHVHNEKVDDVDESATYTFPEGQVSLSEVNFAVQWDIVGGAAGDWLKFSVKDGASTRVYVKIAHAGDLYINAIDTGINLTEGLIHAFKLVFKNAKAYLYAWQGDSAEIGWELGDDDDCATITADTFELSFEEEGTALVHAVTRVIDIRYTYLSDDTADDTIDWQLYPVKSTSMDSVRRVQVIARRLSGEPIFTIPDSLRPDEDDLGNPDSNREALIIDNSSRTESGAKQTGITFMENHTSDSVGYTGKPFDGARNFILGSLIEIETGVEEYLTGVDYEWKGSDRVHTWELKMGLVADGKTKTDAANARNSSTIRSLQLK